MAVFAGKLETGDGFRIFGADFADQAGYSASVGGDINGDGFAGPIVGARLGDGPDNTRTRAAQPVR